MSKYQLKLIKYVFNKYKSCKLIHMYLEVNFTEHSGTYFSVKIYGISLKLLYTQRWRNTEIPLMEEWIVKMVAFTKMAKVTCSRGNSN